MFGAFDENNILHGYAYLADYPDYAEFLVLKSEPDCEKFGINAALVDGILSDYNDKLKDNYYICDGAKAIRHQTHFQDYPLNEKISF